MQARRFGKLLTYTWKLLKFSKRFMIAARNTVNVFGIFYTNFSHVMRRAMSNTLSYSDLEICVRTIAELGGDQPEEVRTSLAWVLRNRFERTISTLGILPGIESACEAVSQEALNQNESTDTMISLPDAEWCRIRALNRLVWSGDLADRTGGAIACHRHDSCPDWAMTRTPTALLGSFLFFR